MLNTERPKFAAVENLKKQIAGQVILPGDPAYDEARAVWNGMIDRYPALIVRCTGVADVISAVDTARQNDVLVSVRGGGHNVAGHATNNGGMVIDLSMMKGIHVDPAKRTANAQPGVTWAELDRETQVFGLAAPGGEVSETGIAGLTLGGGIGYLRRKHGLSSDNLLSVDVVTADGQFLHANADQNADLFWAVRGGGGNFGIITNFEYMLHPVGPEVMTATFMYPFEDARAVLRMWHQFTRSAPDEVASSCILWSIPPIPDFPEAMHGQNVVVLDAMYVGTVAQAEKALQPLRDIGTPLVDMSAIGPYVEAQSSFDAFFPASIQRYYWKSLNVTEITDELIEAVIQHAVERPSPQSLIILRHLGGAMARIPAEATAFGDRSAQFNLSIDSTWVDPREDERNVEWTRTTWEALNQHSDGSVYLNFPGFHEEGEVLLRRQFGKNYNRLATIKQKYDPTNLFRLNQNIKPQEG